MSCLITSNKGCQNLLSQGTKNGKNCESREQVLKKFIYIGPGTWIQNLFYFMIWFDPFSSNQKLPFCFAGGPQMREAVERAKFCSGIGVKNSLFRLWRKELLTFFILFHLP